MFSVMFCCILCKCLLLKCLWVFWVVVLMLLWVIRLFGLELFRLVSLMFCWWVNWCIVGVVCGVRCLWVDGVVLMKKWFFRVLLLFFRCFIMVLVFVFLFLKFISGLLMWRMLFLVLNSLFIILL